MGQLIEGGLDSIKMPGSSAGTSASIRNPWDYEVLPSREFVGQVSFLIL
jgi:hypothetical protein